MSMLRGWPLAIAALALSPSLQAAEKLTFLTSWKAQAEHGGYYQALARGYYASCGLDVTIRQGGPAVDGKQLFVAGAVDLMMASFDDTAFQVNQAGFAAQAVMASFQKNPQILMTHAGNGVERLEDMKGRPILLAAASRTTFWPFLRSKYGFTDTQVRPYTGQLAPWLLDPGGIQQALLTNEPHRVLQETGKAPKTFLLADHGYASYGSIVLAPARLIAEKPAAVQCFVSGTQRGWKDFFKDPAPAIALIKQNNPDNPDDVIDYSISTLRSAGIVETPETAKSGIGTMSDERWKAHFEMMAAAGLIPRDFDYTRVYTTRFLKQPTE